MVYLNNNNDNARIYYSRSAAEHYFIIYLSDTHSSFHLLDLINKRHTLANDCCFLVTATLLLAINIPLLHRANNMVMVKKLEPTLAQQRIYRSQRGWHSSRFFTGSEQMARTNEKGNLYG